MDLFNDKALMAIGKNLLAKKMTIAVAESVTSGLFQFAFSTVPDAVQFFQGGITTYNLAQKYKHLQVEPIHAQSVNCVSQKVANEMALNVCKEYTSDWGIGITGYATPVPESQQKLYAYFAIANKDKIKSFGKLTAPKMEPTQVQVKYVNDIVKKLQALIR